MSPCSDALEPDVVLGERAWPRPSTSGRSGAARAGAAGRSRRRPDGGAASTSSTRRSAPRARPGAGRSPSRRRAAPRSPLAYQRDERLGEHAHVARSARLSPFAPVGGTMCAASPARNSRPYCIGSTTKLRIAVTPFSRIGPSCSVQPSSPRRVCSSSQIALVRPLGDVLVGRALEVEARELR